MGDKVQALSGVFGRAEAYLRDMLALYGIPGASLGVTDREGILRVSNIGMADAEARRPVVDGTLFEIGSISKSFASIVALQLVEEGKLDLHKPVTEYLPWLKVKSTHPPFTLHHLMSHTAGIIRGTEVTAYGPSEATFLTEFETGSPPGTYFWYSNTGYKLVGLVIESVLGRPYPEVVMDRVLSRLGMNSTKAQITHSIRNSLATGYSPLYDDRPRGPNCRNASATWMESDTADGSISSTATDMCAYTRMMLDSGGFREGRLISQDSFKLFTQRAMEETDAVRGEAYGYGVEVYSESGHAMIAHTGGMIGFTSALLADRDLGIGIVLLTNGLADTGEMARAIMGAIRAELEGREEGPSIPDVHLLKDAAKHAGTYSGASRTLQLRAEGSRLVVKDGDREAPLEARAPDGYYAALEGLDMFLFKPEEDEGRVIGLAHGPDFYKARGAPAPKKPRHPRSWGGYVGHYRTYNPWISNFRIVLRLGRLYMIDPSGHEELLVPLKRDAFRVGKDERCPERIRFRRIVNGMSLEADLSGCPCYRSFTP